MLISLHNVPFIFKCFMTSKTPSGVRMHRKGTKPKTCKTGQNYCFSSFFIKRASSILREPLTLVYALNSSICMEQCTTPSLFLNFEVSQGARNHSLKNYGFHFVTPF